MRKVMNSGDSLVIVSNGATTQYYIDEVLGEGATCVVYSAHSTDGMNYMHYYRIKECYPYNADISRNDGMLVWKNETEKSVSIEHFREAYSKLSDLQNKSNIGNSITHAMDIGEANGTVYQIIDITHGNTYDKNDVRDFGKILEVSLQLAKTIRELHKCGYLHLDIKPSNFLVSYEPSTNVYLFDVDSIVPISNGMKYERISYSEEYAAPEQLQNQRDKIGPSTDVYAIGAILFEKIMGRKVSNSDQGIFAKWDLESKYENPRIRRNLCEIFKKTLAANCKRRYSNVDELIDALKSLIIIENTKHYLISSVPNPLVSFVGRTKELAQINSAMQESKVVFLSGNGGIGKSELIKQWSSLNKDNYGSIVYMRYTESIEKCIESIAIKNVANSEEKYDYLKSLVDETDLLILDNFDITLDAESEWLDKLLDLKSKLIVVSRTNFESIYPQYQHLHIESMACDELVKIFNNESGHILTAVEEDVLDEVFEKGVECTYLVSMAAKLLKQGEYSISEISDHFNSGLSSLEDADEIIDTKDGTRVRHSIVAAMSKLFRLFKLNEYQKSVLSAVYYLERLNIEGKELKRIIRSFVPEPTRYTRALSQLIELGHIQKNSDQLILHSILAEIVEHDLHPSIKDNIVMRGFIDNELLGENKSSNESFCEDTILFDLQKNHVECVMFLLAQSPLDDAPYLVDIIYNLVGGKLSNLGLINNIYFKIIFHRIFWASFIEDYDVGTNIKASIIFETLHVSKSNPGWEEPTTKCIDAMKNAEGFFKCAKDLINKFKKGDEEFIYALCRPFYEISLKAGTHWVNLISAEVIKDLLELNPEYIKHIDTIKWGFSIRCLRNNNYQFDFIKGAKEKIDSEDDLEKKRCISYHACKKIFANGVAFSFVDEEHINTFKYVFEFSKDLFIPEYQCNQYSEYEDDEFAKKILPPSVISADVNRGLENFIYLLSPESVAVVEKTVSESNVPPSFSDSEYRKEYTDINSIMFDCEELGKISVKAYKFQALCGFMESLFEFYHVSLSKEENSTYSADQLKQLERLSNDLIRIGEVLLADSQVQNDLSYYELSDISEFEKTKRSFYRNALLLSITFGITDLQNEYWNKLLEASKELMEIFSEEDIVNLHESLPNSDTGMWGTLDRLQRYGYYDIALKYLQEYCDTVVSYYGYDKFDKNLYDMYEKIYLCADAAASNCFKTAEEKFLACIFLDDENPVLSGYQKYCGIAQEYLERINKINGTKYTPKD